jgi:hypothetical protein
METPKSKEMLLKLVRDARASWDSLVTQIDPELMSRPGVSGEWSIKDVIAHLSAWESRPVALLEALRDDAAVKPANWPEDLSMDETNAWIYRSNKQRTLEEILDESHQVHKRLVQLLESSAEVDLTRPGRISGLDSNTLMEALPGDTYEHFREHAATVRDWLNSESTLQKAAAEDGR